MRYVFFGALISYWPSLSRGYLAAFLTLTYGQVCPLDTRKNSSSCGDVYPLCYYHAFAAGNTQRGVIHTVCIDTS
jgi:hypothetical protein